MWKAKCDKLKRFATSNSNLKLKKATEHFQNQFM